MQKSPANPSAYLSNPLQKPEGVTLGIGVTSPSPGTGANVRARRFRLCADRHGARPDLDRNGLQNGHRDDRHTGRGMDSRDAQRRRADQARARLGRERHHRADDHVPERCGRRRVLREISAAGHPRLGTVPHAIPVADQYARLREARQCGNPRVRADRAPGRGARPRRDPRSRRRRGCDSGAVRPVGEHGL
jgi:hypothetical protein